MCKIEEIVCDCPYGTVSDEDREIANWSHSLNEVELQAALDRYKWKDDRTRSGHDITCPVNLEMYEPGEFLCHCMWDHAVNFLIPHSDDTLTTGPLNPDALDYKEFLGVTGVTGVYVIGGFEAIVTAIRGERKKKFAVCVPAHNPPENNEGNSITFTLDSAWKSKDFLHVGQIVILKNVSEFKHGKRAISARPKYS
jgi:hypothetical protein